MKLRHILVYDGTTFDLREKRVIVDADGHPLVWTVEHADVHKLRSTDTINSFWLTYLEAD